MNEGNTFGVTHGLSHTHIFRTWNGMKKRCRTPSTSAYPHYGGRGIDICEAWETFEPFLIWAIVAGYKEGLSIDRIDGTGNYEPENCRWLTRGENARLSERYKRNECYYGHKFTGDNICYHPRGHRMCRLCRNRRQREYNKRKSTGLVG